jgi:hypothetical protein
VHVLRRLRAGLRPGGIVLDLQVIRPHPRVEANGRVICEIDGSPLFATADAARDALDLLIAERSLDEEAVDDHDVLKHYATGFTVVEDFASKERKLPAEAIPALHALHGECVVRERCRLRRLRRTD